MAAARALGSVTLVFNVLTVPTKIFTAQSKKDLHFNRIVKATGSRVKQLIIDESTNKTVVYADIVQGFEYELGKFVTFTAEELKALEAEGNPEQIRIREVVPLASVDSRYLGKAQYLGPGKGSDYSFALVTKLLSDRGLAAVGQWGGERRDELVVVRAQEHGLVLHECLYDDEVRKLAETIPAATFTFKPDELELAGRLLDSLALPAFSAERFVDRGAVRVKKYVDAKVAGAEIVIPAPTSEVGGAPVQLLDQLRASVPARGAKKPGVAKSKAPASEVVSRRRRHG